MRKLWEERGWEEYLYWQEQDKKTIRKINNLIRDIERADGKPPGKSEKLKGNLSGLCSSRIDEKNRLVWYVAEGYIHIVSCRGHYQ